MRQAGFELVHGGYAVAEVDEFLDGLEERVFLAQAMTVGRRGKLDPGGEADFLKGELAGPYMRRFPRAGGLVQLHPDDVDEFVDRVVATLDGQETVTVEDVRSAPFRPRRGGYARTAWTTPWTAWSSAPHAGTPGSDAPQAPPVPRSAD